LNRKSNIAILILAAGGSTRMGSPKQLLKWKQTTLIGHTIATAQKLELSKTIIVLGANYNSIKTKIERYQVETLINKDWRSGLGNSIAFGVRSILECNLDLDGVLVILADQPLVDTAYLNSLIKAFEIGKRQIIASAYKENKQGVPVLFDKFYFKELSQLNDDKGAKAILQKYANKAIGMNAEGLVSDIDTLDDYKKLYNSNHQ
jgi:molybdenum cofactor cytidylyltransferase